MDRRELSKRDANGALDLIHDALCCQKKEDYLTLLSQLNALVGYDHVRCAYLDKSLMFSQKMEAVKMIVSFPEEWEERYNSKGYVLNDSVALYGFYNDGLSNWKDAEKKYGSDASRIVLDEASTFGLNGGWIFTSRGKRTSECAVISIAGKTMKYSSRSEKMLNHMLPHLCQAIRRIHFTENEPCPRLTPREIEVLSWITKGKSAWDISIILKISNRTVEFHTRNILCKLDAVNSQQAVAKAMDHGLLYL